MSILPGRRRRWGVGALLGFYVAVSLIAVAHHDLAKWLFPARAAGAGWEAPATGAGGPDSATPALKCPLCSFSRTSIRLAPEPAMDRPDPAGEVRAADVSRSRPRTAPGGTILLRAPPAC